MRISSNVSKIATLLYSKTILPSPDYNHANPNHANTNRTEHGFTMWSPNTNRTEHREKNSDRTRTEQNTGKEILTEHEQNRTLENNFRANTPNMRVREHACSSIPGRLWLENFLIRGYFRLTVIDLIVVLIIFQQIMLQ